MKLCRSKRSNVETEKDKQVEVTVGSKGSSDASLSIEETKCVVGLEIIGWVIMLHCLCLPSKLRLQLGLKPLDLGGDGGRKETLTTGEPGQDNVDEEGDIIIIMVWSFNATCV